MRTKLLLLTAAIGAAGAVTSMAQVYSVNAVGYVNTTVPANGFALISNPLIAADNTIDKLFAGVPNGTQIYVYANGKYTIGNYDDLDNSFGDVGKQKLEPGQGAFIRNADPAKPLTITFVGEVPQGTLTVPMVPGLQIVSSKVPQAGTTTELGFPNKVAQGLTNGDQLYKFGADQKYEIANFDDLDDNWSKQLSLGVGEAMFVKLAKPLTWTRTFSVNP